ncbi:MAG: hypothetical protein ACWGG5_05315 [Stenotrophomonas sp.]|jgi:hypothetical protein
MEDRLRTRAPAHAPQPFWQRLRAITLYPLRGPALYSLVALTLCTLLELLPGIGWILNLITWVAIYRYAFEILRETANGRMRSPEHTLGSSDGTVLRLLGLMILMGIFVVAMTVFLGPVAGLLALAVVVFLQPGCVISLALDGSLRTAANPATSIALATRIGWPYLAAFLLLFVIQASALTAGRWLHAWMPPVVGELALNLFAIWGLFSAFHLLGYLVYQYHGVLGFDPEGAAEPLSRHDPDRALLDEAEHFIREGHRQAALETLRGAIRSRAVGLPVHALYQRLLVRDGASGELREHGRQYISRLLMEKQERVAMSVLREILEHDPDFTPAEPEQAELLAARAAMGGQFALQMDLLRAMLRAWPRAAQAPQWALQAAMLLGERYNRDAEALQLLDDALARCDDDAQRHRLASARDALRPRTPREPVRDPP